MADVASRLRYRVQLTTDAHKAYLEAVEDAFGSNIDYAQLVKMYGSPASQDESPTARRYSPNVCTGVEVRVITGDPESSRISTSYIERSNLTLRMGNRRFTRLTNAFSRRVENHAASVSLFMFHYNFGRVHRSLANPYPRTPAMAAGVSDHVWTCEEIAGLVEQDGALRDTLLRCASHGRSSSTGRKSTSSSSRWSLPPTRAATRTRLSGESR
jgi:hypothetical protein